MTIDSRKRFGARFKSAREQLKMTQLELAAVLGVSGAVISDWEKGKTSPQLERLEAIAASLSKPVSYFFTDPWETTGHSAGNLAFYVRVYNNTIRHLRDREMESQRATLAFRYLREHLAAQAALLLKSITPEELAQISMDDLDESIRDFAASSGDDGATANDQEARDSLALEAYQTLANLEDAMEKAAAQPMKKTTKKGQKGSRK
jgi:transcriptional regulator with XRE-family HTH domain